MNTQVNLGKTKFRWPIIENSSHKKNSLKVKIFPLIPWEKLWLLISGHRWESQNIKEKEAFTKVPEKTTRIFKKHTNTGMASDSLLQTFQF